MNHIFLGEARINQWSVMIVTRVNIVFPIRVAKLTVDAYAHLRIAVQIVLLFLSQGKSCQRLELLANELILGDNHNPLVVASIVFI